MPDIEPVAPEELKLSAEERESLGRDLVEKIQASYSAARDQRDDVRRWRDQYDAKSSPKNFPWANSANLNVPITRSMLDSIHARALRVMRGVSPFFRVSPLRAEDVEVAKKIEDQLEWQMNVDVCLGEKLDEITFKSLRDGNSIVKLPWVEERATTRDRLQVTPQLKAKYPDVPELQAAEDGSRITLEVGDEIVKQGPDPVIIDILDWVMYPHNAKSINAAVFCGHRFWKNDSELRHGARNGLYNQDWVDELLDTGADKPDPTNEELGGDPDRLDEIGLSTWTDMDDKDRPMQFFELIAKYDVNGDGFEQDCLFVVEVSRAKIIRAIPYPYWHRKRCYINYCPLPRHGEFYGYSVPKILCDIAAEINAIRNQRVDAGTITLAPMMLAKRGARNDLGKTRWRPGGVLWVDNTDDIKPLYMQANTQAAFAEEGAAREMAERVMGVSDYAQGQSPSRSRTLGEIQAVLSEGNLKFDVIIQRLQVANNELANQVIGLNRQFMDDTSTYGMDRDGKVLFADISKEEICRRVRILAHGNTMNSNPELDLQKAEKLYMMVENNVLLQKPTRLYAVTKNYLDTMKVQNVQPFIGTLEEAKEMEDQAASQPPPMPPPAISGKMDEIMTIAELIKFDPDYPKRLEEAAQLATTLKIQSSARTLDAQNQMQPEQPLPDEAHPGSDNDDLDGLLHTVAASAGGNDGQAQ